MAVVARHLIKRLSLATEDLVEAGRIVGHSSAMVRDGALAHSRADRYRIACNPGASAFHLPGSRDGGLE